MESLVQVVHLMAFPTTVGGLAQQVAVQHQFNDPTSRIRICYPGGTHKPESSEAIVINVHAAQAF